MGAKFFVRQRRLVFVVLSIVLITAAFFLLGMHLLSERINQNRDKIAAELRQGLGSPVTFEEVRTGWSWRSLSISLKNVIISDSEVSVPFASIGTLKIYLNFTTLLFNKKLEYHTIALEDLKIVVGWDGKGRAGVKGLKGESLPGTIEYSKLMQSLSKLETVRVKRGLIDWQGARFQIKQFFGGELKWVKSKETDWSFTGKQTIQIGQGMELPESRFAIEASPNAKHVLFSVDMDKVHGQCRVEQQEAGDTKQKDQQYLECQGTVNNLFLSHLHQYYHPQPEDPVLLQWLSHSLQSGIIQEGSFKIQGHSDALTWQGEIMGKDLDFQYTPGWPNLEEANALVKIETDKITVQLLKGKILDVPVEKAFAIMEPIGKNQETVVHVEGAISSTVETGLEFLENSPLKDSVAKTLEPLNPEGAMHLDLKLTIPLKEKVPITVEGMVAVREGLVNIPDWNLEFHRLNGNFHFTSEGVDAPHISAWWGQKPLQLTVATVFTTKYKEIQIGSTGIFSSEFLQKEFQVPFLNKLQGESIFTLTFKTPFPAVGLSERTRWLIESDLKGMAVDLPNPLGKKRDQEMPVTVSVGIGGNDDHTLSFNLNKILEGKLIVSKTDGQFQLKRGNLVFGGGKADLISKNALLVTGELNDLDAKEWIDFFEHSESHISVPLNFHMYVEQLALYGIQLRKTWFSADFSKRPVTWELEGPFIKGMVTFPSDMDNQFKVDLDYLKVMPNEFQTKSELLSKQNNTSLSFRTRALEYNHNQFGQVSFILLSTPYGYEIKNLLLKSAISEFSGNGEWRFDNQNSSTSLQGKVVSSDMGALFSKWGYSSAIKESNGVIQYRLFWPNDPFQFSLALVEGGVELRMKKGRILGVDPGLGRILGLLNLENIKRRLQLDFRDLYKKGFIFDSLKGTFTFQKGKIKTNALFINGPAANIEIVGTGNLENKTLDLNMTVTPGVGSVVVPLVGVISLAANPVVGAVVGAGWLLDKLGSSHMQKLTRHFYHVTGTWDALDIQEVGSSSK